MGKKKDKANGTETNGTTEPAPPDAPAGAKAIHRYTDALPVALDEAKRATLSAELVGATTARVGKENEIAVLREAVKGLRDKEASLVGKLEEGSERADVEVVEYLLPTNEVQAVRTDTGEVVSTRTADAEDLQEDMPFDGGAGDEMGAEFEEHVDG